MAGVNVKPKARKSRITLKDIADELGVAPSTVSNAYNRPDQLSSDLRAKILETAERLGYVGPDPTARSLRRGMTDTVGVVYPSQLSYAFTDPVAALFIQGIAFEVEREGYGLLLVGTPDTCRAQERTAAPAATVNADGFIIHCFAEDDPLFQATLARRLPTVVVDNLTVEGLPYVTVDDEGGARAAAEHLLALGHRRLGIISLELSLEVVGGIVDASRQAQAAYGPSRARLRGYRKAAEAAGLAWEEDVSVYECTDNTLAEGEQAAAALLAREPRPSGILAMSDQLALGALGFARARGITVPAELSVVGFDDILGAAQARPALTTVHQPHVEKGRQAGRLLIAQLKGQAAPESVVLPTRLVVRQSSAQAQAVSES